MTIENQTKQLIVAFYLAKFNEAAIRDLGFNSFKEAFEHTGRVLGYKPATIKNRRDDFDPLFKHRAGWYQVELSQRNLEIVDHFDHLSEEALRAIVFDILNGEAIDDITIESMSKGSVYTTRGVTGKKAEEYFSKWFSDNYPGETLIDTRDLGCGYDYEIGNSEIVFEVKGLSGEDGGIQFTDKEWSVANSKKDNYRLALVRNCFSDTPLIEVYTNPSEIFTPKKQISTVINVNWGVSARDLRNSN